MLDGKITISTDDKAIELFALFTEVLGMQAENTQREIEGYSTAYGERDFIAKADKMRELKFNEEEHDGSVSDI